MRETYKQLENKDVYEEVQYDSSILIKTIMGALEKIRIRGDHPMIHLITSWSKILNLLGFILYLRFPNVGKPVISNWGFYTENISPFRVSFTTYSSESKFIHRGYKSLFHEN